MRSELVIHAVVPVRNRFLLVQVASVLTRKFHRPIRDRIPLSINQSLSGLAEGKYLVAGNVIREGVLDLHTYNGVTGDAHCSYVKPEFAQFVAVLQRDEESCGQLGETA